MGMGMDMGMCGEMLTAIQQTTAMAAFATPDLRQMFVEWMAMLETEALEALNQEDATDVAGLTQKLNISEESAAYLIAHMAKQSKVNLRAETKKAL